MCSFYVFEKQNRYILALNLGLNLIYNCIRSKERMIRFPRIFRTSSRLSRSIILSKNFSGHGRPGEPHYEPPPLPETHAAIGKVLLVIGFLWVLYQGKEDGGKLFGLYKPWEHEHVHGDHLHYKEGGDFGDSIPILESHSEEDADDEEEEE